MSGEANFPAMAGDPFLPRQREDSGDESQTDLKKSSTSSSTSLSREYHPFKQEVNLAKQQGWRLLLTCIFAACVVIVTKVYENMGNMSHHHKNAFNTILTGLTLALGLNFFDAFKDMARVLRWRLLADRPFTIRETDLILGGDAVTKPLMLLWESWKKPILFFSALSWILLNVTAQICVAIIGLTVSMDNGTNSNGTYTELKMVNASRLDCFYNPNGKNCDTSAPEANLTIAHAHGATTRGLKLCDYAKDEDIFAADQTCDYFRRADGAEFAYRFWEINPADTATAYPFLTNRTIRASHDQCFEYRVTDQISTDTTDGKDDGWLMPFSNKTYSGTLPIPKFDAAYDATTFIYNGTLMPQDALGASCGPRCIQVWAFRSYGDRTRRPNTMFSCNIAISEVLNATSPIHQLPNDVARVAAASIALSGRFTSPGGPGTVDWHQYQLYPWAADWEINLLDADTVGSRMAEFAIGTLAGMAVKNPAKLIEGSLPVLGYHLSVHWNFIIPLMAGIAAAHAILFLLLLMIAKPIVIVDDSFLCTARVLNGLVQRLHGGGTMLNSREMARAVQRKCTTNGGKVVFGVREGQHGQRMLDLAEDIPLRHNLHRDRFPKGIYL